MASTWRRRAEEAEVDGAPKDATDNTISNLRAQSNESKIDEVGGLRKQLREDSELKRPQD